MTKELRLALEKVIAKCDLPKPIKGEEWLRMFYEIQKLVDVELPEWFIDVALTKALGGKRSRYYELKAGKWYPRLNRYSTWESIQCFDERYKDDYLVDTQRKEVKRKIRKLIIRMDDGKH
ncbi:MAG: hypothetical protein IKW98_06690 [Prevotella sp.]|nr:hypothetical protein [Prevotella sp.]